MQKQSLSLAAFIALLLAMASVGQAQSAFTGNGNYTGNENFGTVVWGSQEMIQPGSMMPIAPPVDSAQVYGVAPVPPIPLGQSQEPAPFFLPAVPVLTAYPVQPPVQYVAPSIQHVLPATIQQPVCLPGG